MEGLGPQGGISGCNTFTGPLLQSESRASIGLRAGPLGRGSFPEVGALRVKEAKECFVEEDRCPHKGTRRRAHMAKKRSTYSGEK